MTIVRVGSNSKYADGWEAAFSRGKKSKSAAAPAKKAGAKQTASAKKKAAGKKKGRK